MQRSNTINHTQMVTIHYTTSLIKHKKLKVAKIPSLTLSGARLVYGTRLLSEVLRYTESLNVRYQHLLWQHYGCYISEVVFS